VRASKTQSEHSCCVRLRALQVLLEYNYISTGDDCYALKSGWDKFGYTYVTSAHENGSRLKGSPAMHEASRPAKFAWLGVGCGRVARLESGWA
jgi:hypothetical protein